MNKEYIYMDGKIVVRDEHGKSTQREYSDNLNDILVQENLIETIETEILNLEKEREEYRDEEKRYSHKVIPAILLACSLGVPIIAYLLGGTAALTTTVDSVFGPINEVALFAISIAAGSISIECLAEYCRTLPYKISIKVARGIDSELAYLRKRLIEEKEKLEELKRQSSKEHEETTFRTVTVDDLEALKSLRNYINFYYGLGYNAQKYYQYFLKGQLEQKLEGQYTETEMRLAKEFLEEQGPSFVMQKKKNRTRD